MNSHARGDTTVASDSKVLKNVLGHFPTGVTAVTATDPRNGEPVGMTIGSFTSVSFSPPLVAFFPAKKSGTWASIQKAGTFCVNVMSKDQLEVCAVMASHRYDKFADVAWYASAKTGSPIIEGSIAFIDCMIEHVYDGGDHNIVVGSVQELAVLSGSEDTDGKCVAPMVFYKDTYGTFTR